MGKKIRIGNDILVQWTLTNQDGTPYSLSGVSFQVYLVVLCHEILVENPVVSGNVITFSYLGMSQETIGNYGLKLVENDGQQSMVTFDIQSAFQLVRHSWLVGGTDATTIQTETVEITSALDTSSVTAAQIISALGYTPLQQSDIAGKADKAVPADAGNLASLSADGNLADSGVGVSDLATAAQGAKADTAVQPGDLATVATTGAYEDLTGRPAIPTKTSDLENDSGFVTDAGVTSFNGQTGAVSYTAPVSSVNGQTGAVSLSIPDELADLSQDASHRTVTDTEKAAWNAKYDKPVSGIPASDLASGVIPDVSNFITKSVDDLTNYYLKNETYTKAEVQALIAQIQGLEFVPVETLPTASADTLGKIYLIPASNPQAQNLVDEYYTKDNGAGAGTRYTWELFGSASIDLSGYVTTSDLNTALADYTTTSNLTTLLAAKQDVIDATHKLPYSYLSDTPTIPDELADLSSDSTHRLVTDAEKSAWDAKYDKPSSGIPKTALASAVQASLDKADTAVQSSDLARVATTGAYSDLSGTPSLASVATSGDYDDLANKPTIPAAQIQSDWEQTDTTAKDYIKNKPTIPAVAVVDQTYDATSANAQSGVAMAGALADKQDVIDSSHKLPYAYLSGTPTIPTVEALTTSEIDTIWAAA